MDGQSILTADLEAYRTRLTRSPWVADASLRRLLPSTLEVTVLERAPMGLARLGAALYLVDQGGAIVPVEVKSGKAPFTPHPAHVMQLAAYCLLVEATYQRRPPHGVLQYSDRAFAIPYNNSVRDMVFDTLAGMRRAGSRPPDRSHESAGRCAKCGYRGSCDQRLA